MSQSQSQSKGDLKLLIIDDDPESRRLLEAHLSPRGHEVSQCEDSACALQAVQNEKFDLILLDYMLPDRDGISLLQDIQDIDSDIPVIMLTAYSTTHLAVQFMKQGGLDFIEKPVRSGEVLDLQIRLALERFRLRKREENTRVDEYRRSILATVSHELRTPLTIIQSSAEILENYNERLDSPQRMEQIGKIKHASLHMNELVNSVIRSAELQRKAETFAENFVQDSRITVPDLIEMALEQTDGRGRLKRKALTYQEDFPADDLQLSGPTSDWIVALAAVIDNAIKFTESGGIRISSRLESEGEGNPELIVSVSDTGSGIPPEYHERIFHDFEKVRVDGVIAGPGLGLGFAERLLQKSGGHVALIRSDRAGSEFQCRFPVSMTA